MKQAPAPENHTWRRQAIGKAAPLPPRKRKHEERDLQDSIDSLMLNDGWRIVVTDPPHLRGLGVSEPGMPDRLYFRYLHQQITQGHYWPRQHVELLWLENKRKGGKAQQNQKDWIEQERRRGALVWLAGEDFEASVDGFLRHYKASGLARKVRL